MCGCLGGCTCSSNSTILPIGPTGAAGTNGTNGTNGADGIFGGYSSNWKFSTSTSTSPASTEIRFNNATYSSVTAIYIHQENYSAINMANFIDTMDDTGNYGYIRVFKYNDATKFWLGKVTNVTDNGSDYTLTVTYVLANSTFAANDQVVVTFTPIGGGIRYETTSFNDATNAFYSVAGIVSNTSVGSFVYPGSGSVGTITKVYANIWSSNGATSVTVRLRDVTNSQTICSASTTATTATTILDLGVISNIPAGPAKFQIEVSCPDSGQSVKIASLTVGVF